ncbi:MAG TPA: flagellar hook-basal body protein [bacterium]|nr:flagellar hook-basal body protein [bacterium]
MQNIHAVMASMVSRMRQLEITANNLSNVNTPGFKRNLYFSNILEDLLSRAPNQRYFDSQLRLEEREKMDFSQGALQETENPLDVGFNGPGFFVIRDGDGVAYTRNGNFNRDADGYLVTNTGQYVMGESGPIWLDEEGQVQVSKAGYIMLDGEFIDRLRIVRITDQDQVDRLGDSRFMFPAVEAEEDHGDILQGYLEKSNADPISSITEMISLQRDFESNQRMLRTIDGIDRLASNEIGRLQ